MYTHPSCKITETWESFNNRGTKIYLVSDDLRFTANNSQEFSMKKTTEFHCLAEKVHVSNYCSRTWHPGKCLAKLKKIRNWSLRITVKNCIKNYENCWINLENQWWTSNGCPHLQLKHLKFSTVWWVQNSWITFSLSLPTKAE